jgi:hypothetical protein
MTRVIRAPGHERVIPEVVEDGIRALRVGRRFD